MAQTMYTRAKLESRSSCDLATEKNSLEENGLSFSNCAPQIVFQGYVNLDEKEVNNSF